MGYQEIYKVLFGKVLISKFLIVNETCSKASSKSFLIPVVNFCAIYLGIVKFIFFVSIKLFLKNPGHKDILTFISLFRLHV